MRHIHLISNYLIKVIIHQLKFSISKRRALSMLFFSILLIGFPVFSCYAQPFFSPTPVELWFGNQISGTTASKTFTITNTGNVATLLQIRDIDATIYNDSEFITSITPRTVSLNVGQSQTFTVNVTFPSSTKTYYLWIEFSENGYYGSTGYSIGAIPTTDIQAPTAPTNLISSNVTSTTATLSWTSSTDNVGVTGYDIYKNGTLLTTSTTNSFGVTGLTAITTYSFYVKAKDAAGNTSNASNTINVTTTPIPTTTAPTNLTVSNLTSTSYYLSWTKSENTLNHFYIYVNGASNYSYYTQNSIALFQNLVPGTTTTYRVTAALNIIPALIESPKSLPITITTPPLLIITGSTSELCNSNARTFSTTSYSNATYQWSVGSGLSLSGATSPTVTVTANAICKGNRTLTLTRTMTLNGIPDIRTCSTSFYVGVPQQPTNIVFTPETPCLNTWVIALVTANNPANSGVHYEWWGGGHTYVPQNGEGTEVQFATKTLYWYNTYVYVRATNVCGSTPDYSEFLTVNDCGGGIISPSPKKPFLYSKISLYPNPTNDIVNIELPKSKSENSLFEIKVFDILGKLLLTKSSITGNSKQSIDLSQYNSGNYIIIISNSEGLVEKQLINLSK